MLNGEEDKSFTVTSWQDDYDCSVVLTTVGEQICVLQGEAITGGYWLGGNNDKKLRSRRALGKKCRKPSSRSFVDNGMMYKIHTANKTKTMAYNEVRVREGVEGLKVWAKEYYDYLIAFPPVDG